MKLRKSEIAMLCLTALFVLAAGIQAWLPTRQVPATLVRTALAADAQALRISGAGQSAGAGGRININTADAGTRSALPGIGTALAGRIIDYRTEHGPFARTDELLAVDGIGEKTYEALKDLVTCEEVTP
jgi:competence protein ComEA